MYLLNSIWFQNIGFQSFRFILESFYFVSGIALFITAIFQLFFAKKDLKTKSKREAITLSSQQCEKFYNELVPMVNKLNSTIKKNELKSLVLKDNQRANFKELTMDLVDYKKFTLFMMKNEDFMEDLLNCTNNFESFSTYFTTGVADSDTSLNIIGKSFCSCIETLYPIIYLGNKNDNRYPSITNLYAIWSTKIDSIELEKKLAGLKSKNLDSPDVFGA